MGLKLKIDSGGKLDFRIAIRGQCSSLRESRANHQSAGVVPPKFLCSIDEIEIAYGGSIISKDSEARRALQDIEIGDEMITALLAHLLIRSANRCKSSKDQTDAAITLSSKDFTRQHQIRQV
jgi:hypothetical protein